MSAHNKMREVFKDARTKISHNALKQMAEKAIETQKKRNKAQFSLGIYGNRSKILKTKRNNTKHTLGDYGNYSKIFLPTNKENRASTRRNYIQKSVKHHQNTKKRFYALEGKRIYPLEGKGKPIVNFNRNLAQIHLSSLAERQKMRDEFLRDYNKAESRSSRSKPPPRPFTRNRSHTSATLKAQSAPRYVPRPRARNRTQSSMTSLQSKDKDVPEVTESMNGNKKLFGQNREKSVKNRVVNQTLLKECEESYALLKGDTKRMEFSLKHNQKEHEKTNNTLYSLLQSRDFYYQMVDHRSEQEDQTKYGDYKKSYEEIDKKYKILVTFYKELKGKCVTKDTEEDCYMMHKILRSEFNIFKIGRDYYFEQRDQINRLVNTILNTKLDEVEIDMLVKRHFKDDEQATYAYYRKSFDEVNKTYKKVLESYNELIAKCSIHPHLTQMINLQMTELSRA